MNDDNQDAASVDLNKPTNNNNINHNTHPIMNINLEDIKNVNDLKNQPKTVRNIDIQRRIKSKKELIFIPTTKNSDQKRSSILLPKLHSLNSFQDIQNIVNNEEYNIYKQNSAKIITNNKSQFTKSNSTLIRDEIKDKAIKEKISKTIGVLSIDNFKLNATLINDNIILTTAQSFICKNNIDKLHFVLYDLDMKEVARAEILNILTGKNLDNTNNYTLLTLSKSLGKEYGFINLSHSDLIDKDENELFEVKSDIDAIDDKSNKNNKNIKG